MLLEPASSRYFGLDEVGARIWSLLVEGSPIPQIVERLAADYDADPERLRHDVAAFVEMLIGHGLVRRHGG